VKSGVIHWEKLAKVYKRTCGGERIATVKKKKFARLSETIQTMGKSRFPHSKKKVEKIGVSQGNRRKRSQGKNGLRLAGRKRGSAKIIEARSRKRQKTG